MTKFQQKITMVINYPLPTNFKKYKNEIITFFSSFDGCCDMVGVGLICEWLFKREIGFVSMSEFWICLF